jgi:hypothetical protein
LYGTLFHDKMFHMETASTAEKIRRYVQKLQPGSVFTPAELTKHHLGTPMAIRHALARLTSDGTIHRLRKGYYYLPRVSPLIGELSPSREAVLTAVSRKTGATISRPSLDAANRLGLIDQVVARPEYRGNVPRRRDLEIGGHHITIRPAGVRSVSHDADPTDLIINALKGIGPEHITDTHVQKLRRFVQEHDLVSKLQRRASQRAPQWMILIIDRITARNVERG